jgi:hypothetical protein
MRDNQELSGTACFIICLRVLGTIQEKGWGFRGDVRTHRFAYAASVAGSIGSTIDGSSFSGLLTRVEIGHIRIRAGGKGRIKSRGSG